MLAGSSSWTCSPCNALCRPPALFWWAATRRQTGGGAGADEAKAELREPLPPLFQKRPGRVRPGQPAGRHQNPPPPFALREVPLLGYSRSRATAARWSSSKTRK